MFCTNCGSQIADNSTFCPNCGAVTSGAAQNPQQPYGQPTQPNNGYNGYNGGNAGGKAPIKNRSLVTCILLSIVTCGIYLYVWLYNMVNDLNTASNDRNATSGGSVILFTILTCGIYLWIWMYKAGEQLCVARQNALGYRGENSGFLYIILCLFGLGIVSYALIQHELNQLAAY